MTDRTTREETRTVTLRGESREVTFTVTTFEDGREVNFNGDCDAEGAYSKGGKVWYTALSFVNNCGRTDWTVRTNEVFLNRNGYRLIDWADNARGKFDSQHNSA